MYNKSFANIIYDYMMVSRNNTIKILDYIWKSRDFTYSCKKCIDDFYNFIHHDYIIIENKYNHELLREILYNEVLISITKNNFKKVSFNFINTLKIDIIEIIETTGDMSVLTEKYVLQKIINHEMNNKNLDKHTQKEYYTHYEKIPLVNKKLHDSIIEKYYMIYNDLKYPESVTQLEFKLPEEFISMSAEQRIEYSETCKTWCYNIHTIDVRDVAKLYCNIITQGIHIIFFDALINMGFEDLTLSIDHECEIFKYILNIDKYINNNIQSLESMLLIYNNISPDNNYLDTHKVYDNLLVQTPPKEASNLIKVVSNLIVYKCIIDELKLKK
jgi:hypothetical protein